MPKLFLVSFDFLFDRKLGNFRKQVNTVMNILPVLR